MEKGWRDEELLPSTLYARFTTENCGEASLVDHESLLVNLLSVLSSLGDIAPSLSSSRDDGIDDGRDCDVVAWTFQRIIQDYSTLVDSDTDDDIKCKEGSLYYEWSMALRYIHDLLEHIAPVEVHFLASQSVFLSEDQAISHRILCLLLCAHSLQQCPINLKRRWKRWQSLVCETLRIFQDSIPILDGNDELETPAFSLFFHYIAPSCRHVMDQLPLENPYHVAIFSGLVGTSSKILELFIGHCREELSNGTKDIDGLSPRLGTLLGIAYATIRSTIPSFERFGSLSENALWIESMQRPFNDKVDRNEDVDFWMHRDNLLWWIHHRTSHEPEERIANMDTSFHKTGLVLLAMTAFRERPMVYHPSFVWSIWFPHVVVLFSRIPECLPLLESLALWFLESLIAIVPEESLLHENAFHDTSDAHLELFHILSNQLMSRMQTNEDEDKEEEDFKIHSQRTVGLIKALLTRFTTVSQVKIVEKVMDNCSTPGLQARFLDLLRPLILIPDSQTENLLWKLLMSILDDMFQKYWDRKEQILIDIDTLINRDVEISVGAITMIQMWVLAKGKQIFDNKQEISEDLRGFSAALQKLLDRWTKDVSLAPKLHYRLFLLDISLQNTCDSLLN